MVGLMYEFSFATWTLAILNENFVWLTAQETLAVRTRVVFLEFEFQLLYIFVALVGKPLVESIAHDEKRNGCKDKCCGTDFWKNT